jgi:hypothetical protein
MYLQRRKLQEYHEAVDSAPHQESPRSPKHISGSWAVWSAIVVLRVTKEWREDHEPEPHSHTPACQGYEDVKYNVEKARRSLP